MDSRPGFNPGSVIAGPARQRRDPAIHLLRKELDHRVTRLRGGSVMTTVDVAAARA